MKQLITAFALLISLSAFSQQADTTRGYTSLAYTGKPGKTDTLSYFGFRIRNKQDTFFIAMISPGDYVTVHAKDTSCIVFFKDCSRHRDGTKANEMGITYDDMRRNFKYPICIVRL